MIDDIDFTDTVTANIIQSRHASYPFVLHYRLSMDNFERKFGMSCSKIEALFFLTENKNLLHYNITPFGTSWLHQ